MRRTALRGAPGRLSTVVVQRFCKPKVGGSNPSAGTIFLPNRPATIASSTASAARGWFCYGCLSDNPPRLIIRNQSPPVSIARPHPLAIALEKERACAVDGLSRAIPGPP